MIVHTADLHLTTHIWNDMATLSGDSYRAFQQILDFCVQEHASTLVMGGDIFDRTKPDSLSVATFVDGMQLLAQADVDVLVIQGQHERSDPPWACLSDVVRCIGDGQLVEIEDEGVKLTLRGFDNAPAESLKQAIKDMDPVPDILVIHQLAKQMVPFEGSWDFDAKWAPKGVKLILGGDYHIKSNDGKLYYPGSTHMRNTKEFGPHYFMTVRPVTKPVAKGKGKRKTTELKWAGKFDIAFEQLKSRHTVELRINQDGDVESAITLLTEYTPDEEAVDVELPPLVHLTYNPQVEDALSRVTAVCKEKGYFLRTKTTLGGTEVVEGVPQLGAVTLEECLARVVDRTKEPAFFSFALALLTGDARTALDAAKAQFDLAKETN
jgi:DNA repair exonuclease SbcCD nuclease subunit